jgi:hypothetical protein
MENRLMRYVIVAIIKLYCASGLPWHTGFEGARR